MSIILKRVYNIPGKYTEEEREIYENLIDEFRLRVHDDIPADNILYEKASRYKDGTIIGLLNAAVNDINIFGIPPTKYSLKQMSTMQCDGLIVLGAMVCMCVREGLFHAANQIDFNDSGLSIGMYNKSGIYQGWYGALLNEYVNAKQTFKSGVIANSYNAGFVGIGTEFSYRFGGPGYSI